MQEKMDWKTQKENEDMCSMAFMYITQKHMIKKDFENVMANCREIVRLKGGNFYTEKKCLEYLGNIQKAIQKMLRVFSRHKKVKKRITCDFYEVLR